MSTLTIRKLDPALKATLRVRAARHGNSMEEEARRILGAALENDPAGQAGAHWLDELRALVVPLGGLPALERLPDDTIKDPFADHP